MNLKKVVFEKFLDEWKHFVSYQNNILPCLSTLFISLEP